MKKVLSILISIAVIFAMSVPMMAFAADPTYKLTISGTNAGHTYDVYQIFTGEPVTDSGKVVKLKKIKYGKNYAGKTEGDPASKAVLDAVTDAAAANKVIGGTAFKSIATTAGSTVIDGLPAGYYLVKETTANIAEGDAATAYMVEMVGDSAVAVKGDSPTIEKQVMDINDTTGEDEWGKSADYDIGDTVPFKITVALPDDEIAYGKYQEYKVEIVDTMTNYSYNDDAVIKVGEAIVTDDFDITQEDDIVTFTCTDVRPFADAGDEIVLEYSADLVTPDVGEDGNPNKAKLGYSNQPDKIVISETPDDPENPTINPIGYTPEDLVNVYTYSILLHKVTAADEPLEGAGFTLYKKDDEGDYIAVGDEIIGEGITDFTWEGIDDGEYKLVETTTPEDFITIDDIEFTVTATHDVNGITTLSGGAFDLEGDTATGLLEADVVNESIRALPETGSLGTKMFYAIGAVLAILGALYFTARRRAEVE